MIFVLTKGLSLTYQQQLKQNKMKNYQIEFILKVNEKLEQHIISVDAKNKKDALIKAKKKMYIPRYFQKIDFYQFI